MAAAAGIAVVAVALLVTFASSLYEVQEKGRGPGIVPYHSGLVYKVRVLDAFTVYDPADARPDADKLSAIALVGATTMTLVALLLLGAAEADARLRRFFAVATAGLALLAADEIFAIHESIGHNLHFLADVPGVERPDDLIFALYVVPLAVFTWRFRDVLLAHRQPVQMFMIGGLFFAIAVVGDLASTGIDEPAEVIASAFLLAGLAMITAMSLRQELDLDRLASSRVARESEPANGATSPRPARAGAAPPATPVA
jgi:hypothetical protein